VVTTAVTSIQAEIDKIGRVCAHGTKLLRARGFPRDPKFFDYCCKGICFLGASYIETVINRNRRWSVVAGLTI
jgi:hypothetical protein